MTIPGVDQRTSKQRTQDERIAAEPRLAPPNLPVDALAVPLETLLKPRHRRPVAVAGVVENGLVRPLDATVKLPENSRVIIVASESS